METATEVRPQPSRLSTLLWWTVLFLALVVADDLAFGWIFWIIAVLTHPFVSAAVAFAVYWVVGYKITMGGLSPNPGRLTGWFLHRLQLERKNSDLKALEESLMNKITSVTIAVPMSLLFGGVVTVLWLYKRTVVNYGRARLLAIGLCAIYAVEFAAIHGLGMGSLAGGVLHWIQTALQ